MLRSFFDIVHLSVWRVLPSLVVFSFFSLVIIQLGQSDKIAYTISLVVTGSTLILFQFRFVKKFFEFFVSLTGTQISLKKTLLLGIALRIVWVILFPIEPSSDSQTYMTLANGLIESNTYFIAGEYAYWPPGYPLFLVATHLGIFKISPLSVTILNMLLYVICTFVIFDLVKFLFNEKSARTAAFLLAIWPNHLTNIGVPFKEYLVFTFLLIAIWIYVRNTSVAIRFLIGVCLGICALAQPGSILFISVFIVSSWYRQEQLSKQLLGLFLCVVGVVVIVGPWTYRNYQVFDEFLMISSNGGSNMYRANNELADGTYMDAGKIVLSDRLGEVEKDQAYKKLAITWIADNPIDFAVLSFRKLILFLGDDSTGVYTAMKRSKLSSSSELTYLVAKFISTLFWLFLWLTIYLNYKKLKWVLLELKYSVPISLAFLYLLTVHAVFESNAKYHFPTAWVILILVSLIIHLEDKGTDKIN